MNFLLPSGTVWQEQGAPRGRSGQKQDSGRPGMIVFCVQVWIYSRTFSALPIQFSHVFISFLPLLFLTFDFVQSHQKQKTHTHLSFLKSLTSTHPVPFFSLDRSRISPRLRVRPRTLICNAPSTRPRNSALVRVLVGDGDGEGRAIIGQPKQESHFENLHSVFAAEI